jgi:inosine-uridine nucleoside N-ribohydrolase
MIKLDLKGVATVQGNLKKIQQKLNNLPDEAYDVFVKNTPIRTGNARSKTKLQNKKKIVANYPYAQRLDQGYSKQSPKGMVEPTMNFIRKRIKQILAGR